MWVGKSNDCHHTLTSVYSSWVLSLDPHHQAGLLPPISWTGLDWAQSVSLSIFLTLNAPLYLTCTNSEHRASWSCFSEPLHLLLYASVHPIHSTLGWSWGPEKRWAPPLGAKEVCTSSLKVGEECQHHVQALLVPLPQAPSIVQLPSLGRQRALPPFCDQSLTPFLCLCCLHTLYQGWG